MMNMVAFAFSVFNDLQHSVNIPKKKLKKIRTFAYEQFPLTYDCMTVQTMFTTFRKLETEITKDGKV